MTRRSKILMLCLCAPLLAPSHYCRAASAGDDGLTNDDFLPPSASAPSENPAPISPRPPRAAPDNSEAAPQSPSAPGSSAAAPAPEQPARKNKADYADEERDYFDANYIRKAAFYDLPYAEIEFDSLSDAQKEKLASVLKRRISVYRAALAKLEDRLESVAGTSGSGGSPFAPKTSGSAAMPVEVGGKTVDAVNGILVARAKDSTATAFFAEIKGRYFIVTNMHVMQSEGEMTFFTYNGIEIKMPKIGFFSKGKDVFIMPVGSIPEGCIALPIEENVSANVEVGDDLLICGNSMGGGTFLHSKGKVVAVGPVNIEHNCNVQQGHSGSPIYSKRTGKIIGVLSHYIVFMTTDGKVSVGSNVKANYQKKIRYFGYRFDNVKDWTQMRTDKFMELSKEMGNFKKKYENIRILVEENSIYDNYDYPEIRKIVAKYNRAQRGSTVALNTAKLELYESLKNLISHEISSMKSKKLDEYFVDVPLLIDAFEKLRTDCEVNARLLK
ncbi:MAG: trypsin-like peptidase domain-containing protein [Opitutales bacterium]|nr:trypsin-like peptidase domain-containing protein [Opitutales bacterium]